MKSTTTESAPTAVQSNQTLPFESIKILVVEDCPDNRYLYKRWLERRGATVTLAEDGLEGSELALKQNFDLVIMDIHMPVMDGLTAMQNLKQNLYDRPVIALTGSAGLDERQSLLQSGFTTVLNKPVELDQFFATIQATLEQHPKSATTQ